MVFWWLPVSMGEVTAVSRRFARPVSSPPSSPEQAEFLALIRPHWWIMSRVAGRLAGPGERDDVLQNAVAVAWHKRRSYDPSRGEARAWLLAITADQARKSWRKRPRLLDGVTSADLGLGADQHRSDAGEREQLLDLRREVEQLSARQRLARLTKIMSTRV